jgi:hypothetical protein
MISTSFNYDSRTLAVKAALFNGDWSVRVFENGQPANGAVYLVSEETVRDAKTNGLDLVEDLMKTAQSDFIRWSDYLESPALHEPEESR